MKIFSQVLGVFRQQADAPVARAVASPREDVLNVPSAIAPYVRIARPDVRHVGEIAVGLGWLSEGDVSRLLVEQRKRSGVLFCNLAVAEGVLTSEQASELVARKCARVSIHAEFDGHPKITEWLFALKSAGYACSVERIPASQWADG